MRAIKKPFALIEQLGRWAMPKTPEEKRVADFTAITLIIIAAIALLYSLR